MPLLNDVSLNDVAYAATSYVSRWLNFETASYFVFTTYCDNGVDLRLEYAVDMNYEIIDTEIVPLVGGTTVQLTRPIKTSFVRFSVINIAPPVDLKIQAYFFFSTAGITALTNVGAGAEVFKPFSEMRSLVSGDASVTITQNEDEIDFQIVSGADVTLASAGGAQTLVNDGVGPDLVVKGLTGSGTVSLSSDVNSVTISGASTDVALSSAGGSQTLVNDGVGPLLAVKGLTGSGTVSLSSDANSVTISGASTDVTLASVGTGESLVNDGTGPSLATKSLIAGTGIGLVSSGAAVTINNVATATPFTQSGQYITPVTLTDTSLIGGIGNVIDTSTRRCFVWGTNCSTKNNTGLLESYAIIGSTTSGNNGPVGGRGNSSGVIFCTDCYQTTEGNAGITENSGIFCSRSCTTLDAGGNDRACLRSAIVGGYNCRIGGIGSVTRNSEQVGILFSENCVCDNYTGTCCTAILASHGSELGTQAPTGVLADMLTIIGSQDCTLGIVDNGERYIDAVFNSRLSQIDGYSRLCAIINSDASSMTGIEQFPAEMNTLINCTNSSVDAIFGANGQARRNIIINGRNSAVRYQDNVIIGSGTCLAHRGNLIATDSLTGVTSAANEQCLFKFSGGYTFYSNDLQTTGVQVTAGGGSWASICDVNKKENLRELVYVDVLERLKGLPVYEFNYKGNPEALKNVSPTAQDWHSCFPDPVVDVEGEAKPLKEQLVIESQDQIGICLAAIKGLMGEVEKLKARIELLEGK